MPKASNPDGVGMGSGGNGVGTGDGDAEIRRCASLPPMNADGEDWGTQMGANGPRMTANPDEWAKAQIFTRDS
jgi:hypothetical protein